MVILYTVYIDELFLLNTALNYILLLLTRRVVRLKASWPRLLLGSVIGAVYAVFMFLPHNKLFYTFFAKFIFSLLLVAVTYNIKKPKQYVKAVAVFYMISFAFGGAAYSLISLTGRSGDYTPLRILALSTTIAYVCIMLLSSYCRRLYLKEKCTSIVNITLNGKSAAVNCYMDTGNNLYDPVSDSPVMIVEHKSISSILPSELGEYYKQGTLDALPVCAGRKIRLIPYSSIGKKSGFILGFKPDSVAIEGKQISDIVIGLCENELSTDNSYAALLNPCALGGII
jgi:stage II sporulation protein GA (sporulation sigma-E factor processing peptidase)